jgi:CheY-like chemotaxis protein
MSDLLVVDDSDVALWALVEMLGGMGHRAHRAKNGAQALRTLERLRDRGALPPIVLTDVDMPEMNGGDLIRACRTTQGLASLSFVLCSGELDNRDLAESLKVPFWWKVEGLRALKTLVATLLESNQTS